MVMNESADDHHEPASETGGDDARHHHHDAHHADDVESVGAAIVTVSSTRNIEEDASGDQIKQLFEDAGHEIVTRELVGDNLDRIQTTVDNLVKRSDVDVVVTNGGTGVTPDDVTVEAVRPLLEKSLPGFGELFRTWSVDEIGTRVIGSRATAGTSRGVLVFSLPGSTNAVTLGVKHIILPEINHLAGLARQEPEDEEEEE